LVPRVPLEVLQPRNELSADTRHTLARLRQNKIHVRPNSLD